MDATNFKTCGYKFWESQTKSIFPFTLPSQNNLFLPILDVMPLMILIYV